MVDFLTYKQKWRRAKLPYYLSEDHFLYKLFNIFSDNINLNDEGIGKVIHMKKNHNYIDKFDEKIDFDKHVNEFKLRSCLKRDNSPISVIDVDFGFENISQNKQKINKNVTINTYVKVILVPSRKEYYQACLNENLWYSSEDYDFFKYELLTERLRNYEIKNNYNKKK